MPKPVIAIDIDDTIADSTESVRLLTNQRTGSSLGPEVFRAEGEYWGYYDRIWREHQLEGQMSFKDYSDEMIEDQSRIPLLPGALFAIKELSKTYRIVLITARDPSWEKATRTWLREQLADIEVDLYLSTSHRDVKGLSKGELCASLGADVLIDDNVEHCMSAIESGLNAILFGEYGWQYTASKDLKRCRNWQAVLEEMSRGS